MFWTKVAMMEAVWQRYLTNRMTEPFPYFQYFVLRTKLYSVSVAAVKIEEGSVFCSADCSRAPPHRH